MSLNDLINIKNSLEYIYYDPNVDPEILDRMPTENDLEETMKYLSFLFRKDELIHELIMSDDIISLQKYLQVYSDSLYEKYGSYGDTLRSLCKRKEYNLINVYFDKNYESIMQASYDEIDLSDPDLCAKVNMIMDFYNDILKHDFKSIFAYVEKCNNIDNICLLLDAYIKQSQKRK